jgi:hypothetical protein
MHTYIKTGRDKVVWTVGYYVDSGTGRGSLWVPLSEHASEIEAACRVNYLNGGKGWEQQS